MSFEKEVEIYTYTLTILNLTLKVKFPCRIYLENQSKIITNEVQPTNNHKFIFNQQVSLKNQSEKDHIQLVVQLITDKGAKYVGGVVKLVETELIGSEGQCIAIPIIKCLDSQAFCEVRVDQVATSRVVKKGLKKKEYLRSEYNPDLVYSNLKPRMNQEGETKSQYNFPISISRKDPLNKTKDPMMIVNSSKKLRGNQSVYMDREGNGGTLSVLEFQVYKQGYNKLKDKFRKQTEVARTEMNKRIALQSNQNNLKLQSMRFKLKAQQLEKTLIEKNQKIKELSQTINQLQKKELDSKYLKQEIENKTYTIKNLQETVKSLTRDNNQLKNMQNQIYQNQQESIQNMKDYVEKIKTEFQSKQFEWIKELKIKNDLIGKRQYELNNKCQEIQRAKCSIEDLDKNLSNRILQMEKGIQNQRNSSKLRQQQLKEKLAINQAQKAKINEKLIICQQTLQQKKNQLTKLQYDKKVMTQNHQMLNKQNQQLKIIKEKHVELCRQHKLLIDQKSQLERIKDKDIKNKEVQINQLTQKLKLYTENNKKIVKDLEEKLKTSQLKCVENESQNQSLRNQLDKAKRLWQGCNKEVIEIKSQLKQKIIDLKTKQDSILALTNQITNANNKTAQGQNSIRIEMARIKEELQKSTKGWAQQQTKNKQYSQTISQLQLTINKTKMQSQFRQEKALKQLGYSKQKIATLQGFKADLQNQITSLNNTINNLKINEKNMNQKTHRLQLQSIQSKEGTQKIKKDIKIHEEKLQNADINLKNKIKQTSDLVLNKQKLQKKINQQEGDIVNLKNQLSQQINEKERYIKISQILQADINKSKEQQSRLTSIITAKEDLQASLREQIKKQKQEFTKADLKLSSHKKQFDKFKESLIDNMNTVFLSIPTGLNSQKQNRSIVIQRSTVSTKENSQVINLMISLGRQTRNNFVQTLQQLKQAIRDNEKLNSDYSLSVNKRNATQFQYNQNITALQQQLSQFLQEKTNEQNKYQQEIFLLQGKIKQKEQEINYLTQKVEEMDFVSKNTKNQFDLHREEFFKKDQTKNRLIEELREQVENLRSQIDIIQKSLENVQQALEVEEIELQNSKIIVARLSKELGETKENNQLLEELTNNLKKDLKKTNEKNEELSMNLAYNNEELKKTEQALKEQQRKGTQLREFLKGLIKQKEQIIKIELQKSEKVLQLQTSIQEMKHQIESLDQSLKKSKLIQEEQREVIKKLNKTLKEEETIKVEQKAKVAKLSEKFKEKERQVVSKDETIVRLDQRLKKQIDKKIKDVNQLQTELDQTNNKLLTLQRQTSQKILSIQNQIQKLEIQNQRLTQNLINAEQTLMREKNNREDLKQKLQNRQKELNQSQLKVKQLTSKVQSLDEQMRRQQQNTYKLQGRINLLQMKFDMKQNQNFDKLQNLNEDWTSKYYSMEQQFEQRIELIQKQKQFLQEKLAQSQKESKKLLGDIKVQEGNVYSLKKHYDQKVQLIQEDRLIAISQKNQENQRLVDQLRITFDSLKLKESQNRKLHNDYQMTKINLSKAQHKCKEHQQKIRNLNKTLQSQSEQFKKKEQGYKKMKENVTSTAWKSERQVRKLIQSSTRQIIQITEQKNTIQVMEISRALEQGILNAISIKIEEKEN